VTLYPPPHSPNYKASDWGKAVFSFKRGFLQEINHSADWDLCYSCLSTDNGDWFQVHYGPETRSVMKDLGEFNWDEPITIPVLQPRPPVGKGKQWQPTPANNDPNGAWTRSGEYAKVIVGHMYLMHVKDENADFYVMFRVEDFEQHKHCTISWRTIPTPKPDQQSQH
jgi:hypothetical protein